MIEDLRLVGRIHESAPQWPRVADARDDEHIVRRHLAHLAREGQVGMVRSAHR